MVPNPNRNQEDPFVAALDAADLDDEPVTAEQRAAAAEAWREHQAGESIPLAEARRRLLADVDADHPVKA